MLDHMGPSSEECDPAGAAGGGLCTHKRVRGPWVPWEDVIDLLESFPGLAGD